MDQGEVFRKYLPRPLQGVLLCKVRGMHFVAHQMLYGKGKLEGGDFWIREGISEKSSLVPYKGFCSAGCAECILLCTKCCVVRGNWRGGIFGSGWGFQKTSPSSLIMGFALRGALNEFCYEQMLCGKGELEG